MQKRPLKNVGVPFLTQQLRSKGVLTKKSPGLKAKKNYSRDQISVFQNIMRTITSEAEMVPGNGFRNVFPVSEISERFFL